MAWNFKEGRGTLYDRDRAMQLADFSALSIGNMTPTDIDGLTDLHGKGFIFIEFKYLNAGLSVGQRIAFERMVDAIQKGGKECILFLCEHYFHNTKKDIDSSAVVVRSYFYEGKWTKLERKVSLVELYNSFARHVLERSSAC